MGGRMVGADADGLASTARHFGRYSTLLRQHRAQLSCLYAGTGWVGEEAERSRSDWRSVGSPALLRTSEFLADLEARLLRHAAEQRRVSAALPSTVSSGFAGGRLDWLDDLFDDWLDDLFDRERHSERDGARPPPTTSRPDDPGVLVGLRPAVFDAPSDGRGAVIAAMQGLADEQRIRGDEIEIRALDNGRYVVVLPGVTDLSAGLAQFVERIRDDPFDVGGAGHDAIDTWSDNDAPTVRKMRYVYEAALRDDTTVNEYSVVTIDALEAAGVPPGADVMLVGHSFGAYTAVDLAADPAFNAAHGEFERDFHVRVTHVVAAGAETDWRLDEVPAGTSTLVLNNRFDLVYRAEDLLHRNADAQRRGHLEQNFWGGWKGQGHDEHNYLDWLAGTRDDDVVAWLDGVGERYTAAGGRVSARVLDPNA